MTEHSTDASGGLDALRDRREPTAAPDGQLLRTEHVRSARTWPLAFAARHHRIADTVRRAFELAQGKAGGLDDAS